MRRIVTTFLFLAAAAAAAFVLTGAGGKGPDKPHYTVVLDNAFGIVSGADLKVAGVRAGTIKDLEVDPKTHRRSSASRSPRRASDRCART
jgi:ABC-type transporter Mla subunit MlaD